MIIRSHLLRPLDYLRIKHPQKTKIDIVIPFILSAGSTIIAIILPLPIKLFAYGGLVASVTNLLQILSGFYIASLAAVATFNKPGMDQKLAGKPVKLKQRFKGTFKEEELTRRRFLCLLFGYLSLMSIFIYFFGAVSNIFRENIRVIFPGTMHLYLRITFIFSYLFFFFNLLLTTLYGLYYLVDRIHRADSVLNDD